MSIKTGFRIVLAIGTAIMLLAAGFFAASQLALIEDTSRSARLDKLADEGSELVQLTTEVLLYGEARALQQWTIQTDEIRDAFGAAPTDGDAELVGILQTLRYRFDQLLPLMTRLQGSRGQQVKPEITDIIKSQLFQDVTQMQASVRTLRAYSEAARLAAYGRSKNRQLMIFASFLGLLAVYVACASVLFRRVVLKPLARLEMTIQAQRAGRRDRVPVLADNEMGTVCQTFNELLDEQNKARQDLEDQAKVLKRANTDLESFAWAAAHDLREPLRIVSNYVALIERTLGPAADSDLKTYIAFVIDGAKRMYDLIGGLLHYARVDYAESGFEPIEMDRVIADCLRDLAQPIAGAQARITVQGPLPAVRGVPKELTRLFRNLIDNAVKFRRADVPAEITIGCLDQGRHWALFVRDNGIGIGAAYTEKIFTIFQRIGPRGLYEGNGIGLSVSKKIAEYHGGDIRVESVEGEGSCFFVTLPKP